MGMRDFSHVRLTDSVINLTGKQISMYDEMNGTIFNFSPSAEAIPIIPYNGKNPKVVYHFVVDEDAVEQLKEFDRTLYDIAVVDKVGVGRNGVEISTLKWAFDPKIPVKLYRGVKNAVSRHL